ncbi:uncharacterized protein A4U43_C05F31720 [Asparagus officinalis]|uniref:Uncharacterized protein n=1 Tax=Asparagus officinalis TaxID=4686 RepID=A0A5P1EWF1_ASPOF|nr:calmodulin-binding protein 60 A-like isoform X2 [Asparagus officinalis]ONK70242.1 uncharacterized protein A4U43_C05F31720 [Asparagus officinalis]
MSHKRQPAEEEKATSGGGSDEKRQKVPALKEVIVEALKMNRVQKLLAALEPLVRRVVKEEVELALANHLASLTRQSEKQVYPSTSRTLQLQFRNKLSLPIFTGTKIEGEESSAISIALVDSLTGQIVESGSESSMKIEVIVLEGDFEGSEEDNWTFEEFNNNVVREREGKRSLLTGDLFLELNEGVGIVGEISFTDNSSWTRSRKFRLGARVVDGYFNGVRVREARTEAFMVKDHRGELYKKHYPPLLWDEVWRLEKIGKDGAFHKRLSSENINYVKDFLTLLSTDAPRLRNILGNGMSAKMWDATIEHARTCIVPNQMHVYFANCSPERNSETGVVFNVVGEVMGLLLQHQFISVNDLSEVQKADAHNLVKLALEHWNDVVVYNNVGNSPLNMGALPSSFTTESNRHPFQDNIYCPSPANIGSFGFCPPPDDIFRGSSGAELETISNPLMLDECIESQTLLFSEEDSLHQYLDSDLLSPSLVAVGSPADLGTAVTGFLAMSARSAARDKANTVWGTLVSVLRWRCSIKKIVAMKRRVHQKEIFG